MDADVLRSRIRLRLAATGKKPVPVAIAIGRGRDYVRDFLDGKKESLAAETLPKLAAELGCSVEYFMDAAAGEAANAPEVLIAIIGRVGASPDGRVSFATGDDPQIYSTVPYGASPTSKALLVDGWSMKGVADHGALIFFEDQRTPPSPDMLGHVVVVETDQDQVLVKRLLKGSARGLYDLESILGPPMSDQRLRWAAHIVSIVPPYQAQRMIRHTAA